VLLAMVAAMQVRSAVIPAAGMGTRFLPATKAVPKELFPIGDQPAIQLVIDEALGAGIDHVVIVSSRDKPAVEEYFAPNEALLAKLDDSGKTELAERLRGIGRDWRVSIVYQDNPKGLGHAVGCARDVAGIDHVVPQIGQCPSQPRGAQRVGTHKAAAPAGAVLQGHADQPNIARGGHAGLLSVLTVSSAFDWQDEDGLLID